MSTYTVTLEQSGKSFSVEPNESILQASRRAGLALPYSCLSGRCGSCAARVLAGQWHYPKLPPSALSAHEAKDHALTCQACPSSDLRLFLSDLDGVARQKVVLAPAILRQKNVLTADVLQLFLEPQITPKEDAAPISYFAGQYLEFVLADGKRRPFSIACAPRADGLLELHVRKVAGGGFTQHLFEHSQIGEEFLLDLPHGTFVPRANSDRELVFLAGGTGFAPVKALLEHYCELDSKRPMRLYWGVREARDLYLPEAIERLQQKASQLQFFPVLSEQLDFSMRYGALHEMLLEDLPDLSQIDVYMSGPPAMITTARTALLAANLPEDRLYFDSFDFAPDVLAQMINVQRQKRGSF